MKQECVFDSWADEGAEEEEEEEEAESEGR